MEVSFLRRTLIIIGVIRMTTTLVLYVDSVLCGLLMVGMTADTGARLGSGWRGCFVQLLSGFAVCETRRLISSVRVKYG